MLRSVTTVFKIVIGRYCLIMFTSLAYSVILIFNVGENCWEKDRNLVVVSFIYFLFYLPIYLFIYLVKEYSKHNHFSSKF